MQASPAEKYIALNDTELQFYKERGCHIEELMLLTALLD